MNNLEFNKIFAAILVAGIVAMLGGFVAELLVHPHALEKPAVFIESAEAGTAGGAPKVVLPDPILPLIADADIARGEKLSKACAACHSFDNGGANKVGPNLWGVVGRPKGAHSGFAYSDGMHAKGGDWGYEDLNQFLWKPKKFIDGTKMNYVGLKKPEDRAALIAWLRTLSSSPKALPSAAEIAKEAADLAPAEEAGAEEAEASPAESH
ncbi:MAG: cytochrome c family protein [Alphaproteobacteria bacterium]|nr:cytochrome c family protein [Alphaproteobacteria bacterium]